MTWRTIRVGFALGLMGLFAIAAQVQALVCGDTITTDTKLRGHLLNCPDNGLVIGASGITLNLNGKRITGEGEGLGIVVEGVNDVTIRNGTVRNFGTQIHVVGSNRILVRHMTLRDGTVRGMQVTRSEDVEVRHTRMSDFHGSGVSVFSSHNFVLRHSRITDVGTGTNEDKDCGLGAGVSAFGSDDVTIRNNLLKRISRAGIVQVGGHNGRILRNTVIQTSSRPCSGEDFGAITLRSVTRDNLVAYNRILANDDFGIGLNFSEDVVIRKNRLRFNWAGIFVTNGVSDTQINQNCISHSDSGIGLEVDREESKEHTIDARHNYWGARSGPSGDGPMGMELDGDGEEVIQKTRDTVEVIPFRRGC